MKRILFCLSVLLCSSGLIAEEGDHTQYEEVVVERVFKAIEENRSRHLRQILNSGVSANITKRTPARKSIGRPSKAGIPALYHAVESGRLRCARILIEEGALASGGENPHYLPLEACVELKNERLSHDMLDLLLRAGGDPTRENSEGDTSLSKAWKLGRFDLYGKMRLLGYEDPLRSEASIRADKAEIKRLQDLVQQQKDEISELESKYLQAKKEHWREFFKRQEASL